MLRKTMSITSERECLTVLRGKLKIPDHYLHQESLRPFSTTQDAEAMLEENYSKYLTGKAKSMHKTLITCMYGCYRIAIFKHFHY